MTNKTINTLKVAYDMFQSYAIDKQMGHSNCRTRTVEQKYASYALASELYVALQCDCAATIQLTQEEKDILKSL